MKKYLLLLLMAIFAVSCSRRVEVKGKITGGSPLERIEFIDATGVGTLPLVNMGVDKDGNFNGSFEAPRDGMYAMTYAGKQAFLYLKRGQKLEISANAMSFPNEFTVTGDAQKNREFVKKTENYMQTYGGRINMADLVSKNENAFVTEVKKIEADLVKNAEDTQKSTKADKSLLEWKKNDISATLLNLLAAYGQNKMAMGNANYKSPKIFTDYETALTANKDQMVRENPVYRNYLLSKLSPDFQKYAAPKISANQNLTSSEVFAPFIKNRKDVTDLEKDYLMAFIIAQYDLHPDADDKARAKVEKTIEMDIKDEGIKKDLKNLMFAINGNKVGDVAPDAALKQIADDKDFNLNSLKGKPSVLAIYSSWTPGYLEMGVPVLKEVINFYKTKANFATINVDDTPEQAKKTSNAMMKNIAATKLYAKDGLNSDFAKKFGIYGFKVPAYIVLDKDGKIASKPFYNLGDNNFVELMTKLTGLKAPEVQDPAVLQNMLVPPPPPAAAPTGK